MVGVRASGTWDLPKPMGWALLAFYAVFTVIYAATEVGFLWAAPWVTTAHHHAS